jgi:hypothetical protein
VRLLMVFCVLTSEAASIVQALTMLADSRTNTAGNTPEHDGGL